MRILLAEDDPTSALLLDKVLQSAGYSPVVTRTGLEALRAYKAQPFDVVLTDWMMPELDGIGLVKKIRELERPGPVILMVTALTDTKAREHALRAGVDGYVTKPITRSGVLDLLNSCVARRKQAIPARVQQAVVVNPTKAPAVAVGIAASTGGPPLLFDLIPNFPTNIGASYLITQHGPAWTLDMLASGLKIRTSMPVKLATEGMPILPNEIYIAPGNGHLTVTKSFLVKLSRQDVAVGLRPAADPMFASIAQAYGSSSVGVVLTGLGRDGSVGGQYIMDAGGEIIAQMPSQAAAPFMPESAIALGLATTGTDSTQIPAAIRQAVGSRSNVRRAS